MKPVYIISAFFLALTKADWEIQFSNCATGIPDSPSWVSMTANVVPQGACGGCSGSGMAGDGFHTGNPCDCNDRIHYQPAENGEYNMIVEGTGINIGRCYPRSGGNSVCNYGITVCSNSLAYWCQTSYCHG